MRKIVPLMVLALLSTGAAPPLMHTCTPGPYIVFFDWSSSALKKQAVEILDNAVQNEGDCGPMTVVLAGHTDTSEPATLSRQRLKAVSNYFASRGIFVKRRNVLDYGARQQRVATAKGVNEPRNRRVEIIYGPGL